MIYSFLDYSITCNIIFILNIVITKTLKKLCLSRFCCGITIILISVLESDVYTEHYCIMYKHGRKYRINREAWTPYIGLTGILRLRCEKLIIGKHLSNKLNVKILSMSARRSM